MTKIPLIAVILASLVGATPALAEETVTTIGAGMVTCQFFAEEYRKNPVITETLALVWAQGFMSATNIVHNYQNTPAKNLDAWTQERQKAKVRSYCNSQRASRSMRSGSRQAKLIVPCSFGDNEVRNRRRFGLTI